MKTIENDSLVKQLEWRYATKKFDPAAKIPEQDWQTLKEVLRLSPSSYGLSPWRFIVVQNPQLRKQLRAASFNQSQVEDCSHLVVFTALREITEDYVRAFVRKTSEVRSVPESQLQDLQNMMVNALVKGPNSQVSGYWAQKQAYIALGMLLEAAVVLGIDACPMEGFDPSQHEKILGLSQSVYKPVAMVALGYRSKDDAYQRAKKVRFGIEEVLEVR